MRDAMQVVIAKLYVTVFATVALENDIDSTSAFRRADLARLLAFCDDHGLGADLYVA